MKAILIDDEVLALDFLKHQLKKFDHIDIVGLYNVFRIEEHADLLKKVDIIFLDIEMPETNGLELAEKILEINSSISIVFVTAFDEYAVKAFELNAMDYVVKPVQLSRLKKTIDRIELEIDNQIDENSKKESHLHINVSRELSFNFTDEEVELVQWRTAKAKELFLYLLHHHKKTVRKAKLIDFLWTDLPEDRAYSQLYTAIYHIRKALNKFSDHFEIKNMGEGYLLAIDNVSIDLVDWEKKINFSSPPRPDNITESEEIMKLYKGPFLQESNYLWAEAEQYRLEQLWIKAAYRMAYYYNEQADVENEERWYVKICTTRPEEVDAHFSLMQLYAHQGLGLQVERQYQWMLTTLDELNLQVSPHITKWVTDWRMS